MGGGENKHALLFFSLWSLSSCAAVHPFHTLQLAVFVILLQAILEQLVFS